MNTISAIRRSPRLGAQHRLVSPRHSLGAEFLCDAEGLTLRARQFATPFDTARLDAVDLGELMYLPGGDHTITPSAGEGSVEVTVRVDELTADVLNASLAAINEGHAPQRVFFDKEHEAKEATAWPVRFVWRETPQPGVYAIVQWSEEGKRLVKGRIIRSFSPSFLTDAHLPKRIGPRQHVRISSGRRGSRENPARVTGLADPDIGALTNNPAFRSILPLWCKAAEPVEILETATALAVQLKAQRCAPSIICFAPCGREAICAPNGKPHLVTIGTSAALADVLNDQVQQMRANAAQRNGPLPIVDLSHRGWPAGEVLEIFDAPGRGLMATISWTPEAESLILNGVCNSFSPSFIAGCGTPIGLWSNVGGLLYATDRPAFRRMPPVVPINGLEDMRRRRARLLALLEASRARTGRPLAECFDALAQTRPDLSSAYEVLRVIDEELSHTADVLLPRTIV